MPTSAGHDTTLVFLHEDDGSGNPNFNGTPSDSTNKTFGRDVRMTTFEGSNNAVRSFNPGSREAASVIEQQFSGSFSIEFTLTEGDMWWMREVIGNNVSTSGAGPYTHTISGATPYSMRLIQSETNNTFERTLGGCVVNSTSFSASIGNNVTVTLDGAYADETLSSATTTSQVAASGRPMTFAQAVLSAGGSTLSLVQDATLTIENNTDILYELGSRVGKDFSPKVRSMTLQFTDIVEDDDDVQRLYGDTSSPSSSTSPNSTVENTRDGSFVFDNGESGTSIRKLTLDIDTIFPNSFSFSGVGDPESDLSGSLSEIPASISATIENNTSSAE